MYISPRFFLLPDLALRGLAVFGWAVPLDLLLNRLRKERRVVRLGVTGLSVMIGAVAFSILLWPLTPVDDAYRMARENGIRRSQIAAAAVQTLSPVADEDGTVLLVPSLRTSLCRCGSTSRSECTSFRSATSVENAAALCYK